MKKYCLAAVALIIAFTPPSWALDANDLGTVLTQNGADPKASGAVPAYTGGITTPPAGYVKGGDHIDPFAADKPLFTITHANMARYKDRLSAGQLALLERHPETYKMHVYPSRRSCALPDFVYDETKKNVSRAQLTDGGNGVVGARIGVPFPIPKTPVEYYWNHNFHWHGYRYQAVTHGANVFANGNRTRITRKDWRYNYYADPQGPQAKHANDQFVWMGIWTSPPRFNGQGFSMTNTINQIEKPRHGSVFNPSTRKVMRTTPSMTTYDGPLSTSGGLRNNDNMFLFGGSPDRYDWKLVGKREMLVPYNNYRASASTTTADELMTQNHPNPDLLRYEAHRVNSLEATAKPGFNPTYSKRQFYADEDSWIFLMADLYDSSGALTRVQHAFIKNYYEAPACVFEFDVMHDLASGRYNVDHIKLQEGPANLDAEDLEPSDFGSNALKRKIGR
jgi:hypothetical protein